MFTKRGSVLCKNWCKHSQSITVKNISSSQKYLAVAEPKQKVSTIPLQWDEAKPYSKIPGTKSALETMRNFLPGGKYYNKSLRELHNSMNHEYGDLVNWKGVLGKPDFILAFNPKDIEQVYRNEGPMPNRREFQIFSYYRKKLRPEIYGEYGGLLIEHDEKWKDIRGKVNPVMMQPRVVKQYIKSVEEVSDEFITRMVRLRDSNQEMPADFMDELNKWSLESIGSIALDAKLGCLEDNVSANSDSGRMIQAVHDFFYLTFKLEILPSLWKYIPTPGFRKLTAALDVMTEISAKKVDEAVERIKSNPNPKSDSEAGVLEKLLKIDRKMAVVMAMDMLLAGVDTTSNTTAILLYFLAANQKCQDKLRSEILTILPNKDSKLSSDSFKRIPYLRACMKEANRIIPILGGTVRKLPVDVVLSGYQVPRGTEIVVSHQTASMNENQFPDPKKYKPERWLNAEEAEGCPLAKNANPFAHMPFGFGPRSCVGKRFADLEIETFVMKLFRNYKLEWNYDELKVASRLITQPVSPLKFKLTEV
ncbi:probable cytochrome P450 12a5, mitochondrial [Ctenocephalides felis]|uniref:probable cytochrome P450 12a5, mitochondrial n=1 Tax=Ctenocephalides felis TaxID=7515 RepID=UPI000E6E402B|nr:probable cytochrome P450 12a5, mitochondrial [Ctenocephalides felis]